MADSRDGSVANSSAAPPTSPDAWTRNELVLDRIFGFLSVRDLTNVRLTNKCWSAAGARKLAKKSVVQLTDWTFAGRRGVAAEFSSAFDFQDSDLRADDDMWSCACEKRKSTYFSIDHENLASSSETDTTSDYYFEPKKVVLLGMSAARGLSKKLLAQFRSVEQMELKVYTRAQGTEMLHLAAASCFPNLLSLSFSDIIPDEADVDIEHDEEFDYEYERNYFTQPHRKRVLDDFRLVFASKFDEWGPLAGSVGRSFNSLAHSGGPNPPPHHDHHHDVPNSSPESNSMVYSKLRKLSIEISPHCSQRDWSVLAAFPDLEVLEILWWQRQPEKDGSLYHVAPRTCYPECLEKMLPYLLANSWLKHIVLRLNLFWGDIWRIQSVLDKLEVGRVSLQIMSVSYGRFTPEFPGRGQPIDSWSKQKEALVGFLRGLRNVLVNSLYTLHLYVLQQSGTISIDLLSIFSQLDQGTFFQKPEWNLIIQLRHSWSQGHGGTGWIRLRKRVNSLTFQVSGLTGYFWHKIYYELESLVPLMNPGGEEYYNYAFHRVGPINDFENLNRSALFRPYFLTANWTSMEHLVCDSCRPFPRLLCDLPGFLEQAKISLPDNHPGEEFVRTWTFSSVPRAILAKWTVGLVAEIERWRATSDCKCPASWDLVNRFKPIYAFQFIDSDSAEADQDEPESCWSREENTSVRTLASFGQHSSRHYIFKARKLGSSNQDPSPALWIP